MPGHEEAGAVGMEESDCGRKVVIMINQIREVGHRFVALVEGGIEFMFVCFGFIRGVDNINRTLPASSGPSLVTESIGDCWGEVPYSGSSCSTHSAGSSSSRAITITLSPSFAW